MAINSSTLNPTISHFNLQWQPQPHHHKTPISLSFSPKPRRRRRHRNPIRENRDSYNNQNSSSFDSNKLQFVLDVDQLKTKTPIGYMESKLNQLWNSGIDAFDDLRHLVVIEPGSNRVVVSCSDSTVRFVGGVAIWGFVGVVLVRVLVKLGLGLGLGFGGGGGGGGEVVKRRDRSLGGREVVVERRGVVAGERVKEVEGMRRVSVSRKEVKKLPSWWPVVAARRPVVEEGDAGAYRREANILVQAITDDKLRGKDVSKEDILELRRICRMSGIQLSFGTENARDSFYRLAVNNVISTCCRVGNPSVQIDGEDARSFIAGLAYDVGLSNPRAATIVSAAVAAQTRLWFLQAWALEMQAKHSESIEELRKICLIHQIFPPEPSSAEMEMVARGLQKNLNLEQREFLLTNLISVCGEESPRSAAEALGLV